MSTACVYRPSRKNRSKAAMATNAIAVTRNILS
jgi:hypothetical protein